MESQASKNKRALTKKTFEVHFDLENTNYEAVENIGSGAYGVVCSAKNKFNKEKVAIKKIPAIFEQTIIAKRTYREIKILKHFKHDNIIAIREILKPPAGTDFPKDVYIVLDLMESDLHRIIHSKQDLSEDHCKYFVYQILCGLQYIHSANVVHRDLKPSNLLVNANCDLKIGDFGLARGIGTTESVNNQLTQYVATRWYRAPELMASDSPYTDSVDMWSVGCILAELLGRKVLFQGTSMVERGPKLQMNSILDTLGAPDVKVQRTYIDYYQMIIRAHGGKIKKSLRDRLPKASAVAIDLLTNLLQYDPSRRIKALACLRHQFLGKYHDPDAVYEKSCIPVFDFDFEKKDLSKDQLKEVIMKEIMDYHKPKRKSKIPFNFKPVSKSELQKTQQQKAALKARQEAETKASGSVQNTGFPVNQSNIFGTMSLAQGNNASQTSSNQTSMQQPDTANLKRNTPFQQAINQNTPATTPFQNQISQHFTPAADILFKVPQTIPDTKQSLQVTTQAAEQQDVEMISAGRSGSQKPDQGQTHGQTQGQMKNDGYEVEMLSAKADVILDIGSDFKIDLTTDVKKSEVKQGQGQVEDCKGLKMLQDYMEGNEQKPNTKEILKAAILSAAMKKERGETPAKPKPVTALQRQREKEEKRRKKLSRAKEKKKKKAMKEPSPLYTSDDLKLLQRWTNMRNDSKPEASARSSLNKNPTIPATQSRPPLSPRNTNIQQNAISQPTLHVTQNPTLAQQQAGIVTTQVSGLNPTVMTTNQVPLMTQQNLVLNAQAQGGGQATNQQQITILNPMMQNAAAAQNVPNGMGGQNVGTQQFLNQGYVITQRGAQPTTNLQGATDGQPVNVQITQNPSLVRPLYQNQGGQIQIIGGKPVESGAKPKMVSLLGQNGSNLNPTVQSNTSQASVATNVPHQQAGSYVSILRPNAASQPQQELEEAVVSQVPSTQQHESTPSQQNAASNTQVVSPSEFLPFQTYDQSNMPDISNELPTPDFSIYDSPPSDQKSPEETPATATTTGSDKPTASTSQSMGGNQANAALATQGGSEKQGGVLSIITQLKKSHVNDPLMLVVTPKTAGEPYGVGPDMLPADLFMAEERQSAQMSALSNASATESMIGDWLDLIGMDGVTVSDFETLQKELKELPGESLAPP